MLAELACRLRERAGSAAASSDLKALAARVELVAETGELSGATPDGRAYAVGAASLAALALGCGRQ